MYNKVHFRIEVSEAVHFSRLMHKHFTERLADFMAFDSSLNATWAANWQAANRAVELQPSDETILDQMRQRTHTLSDKEKECMKAAIDLKYYVGKAFPDDKIAAGEFGYKTLYKASGSTPHLVLWMKVAHNRADKYKTELMAEGMTQAAIDQLLTLAQELESVDMDQEIFMRERPQATRTRHQVYNDMWRFVTQTAAAANRVYADDKVQKEIFELPRQPKTKIDGEEN